VRTIDPRPLQLAKWGWLFVPPFRPNAVKKTYSPHFGVPFIARFETIVTATRNNDQTVMTPNTIAAIAIRFTMRIAFMCGL